MSEATEIKNKSAPERIALGKIESERVGSWLAQLEVATKGYLSLSKSDLVNFLIEERKSELSSKEIQQIRARHYDPLKHLAWITIQLKQALLLNDPDSVKELQDELHSIQLSALAEAPNKVKNKREKNSPKSRTADKPPLPGMIDELLEI